MTKIKYVGQKDTRADTVANTGVVWFGRGDVQEVPEAAVPLLLKHPDVWALPDADAKKPAAVVAPPPDAPPPEAVKPLTAEELAPLNDKALRALCAERKLKVHHTKKGDALREGILEAQAKG